MYSYLNALNSAMLSLFIVSGHTDNLFLNLVSSNYGFFQSAFCLLMISNVLYVLLFQFALTTAMTVAGVSQATLSRPDLIQTAAACLLIRTHKRDHICPPFVPLRWIPECLRVDFKIQLFIF